MLLEQNPTSRFKFEEPAWPLLIRVKEKYAEYSYIVKKPQEAYKVSLKILTERFNEGHWYYEPRVAATFEEYFLDKFGITIEEAEILKKLKVDLQGYGKSSELIEKVRGFYNRTLDEKKEYEAIKQAVEEKNGKLAYRLLLRRSSYQYEHFEISETEII